MVPSTLGQISAAALLISGVLLISGCQDRPPPALPGQPMTYQQRFYYNLDQQQIMHDERRQDRGCQGKHCI